jgi:hypothetical protein
MFPAPKTNNARETCLSMSDLNPQTHLTSSGGMQNGVLAAELQGKHAESWSKETLLARARDPYWWREAVSPLWREPWWTKDWWTKRRVVIGASVGGLLLIILLYMSGGGNRSTFVDSEFPHLQCECMFAIPCYSKQLIPCQPISHCRSAFPSHLFPDSFGLVVSHSLIHLHSLYVCFSHRFFSLYVSPW